MRYFISTKESKRNESGMIPVSVVFRHEGREFAASTGIAVKYAMNGMVFSAEEPNLKAKTRRLMCIMDEVDRYVLEHVDSDYERMKEDLRCIVTGKDPREKRSLASFVREFAELKSGSTRKIYLRTAALIEGYAPEATFGSVNGSWLDGFVRSIGENASVNYAAINLRNIRAVFNWAIDNEITDRYPFRKFSIKTERQQYLYLNAKEMREVRDIALEPFMERYRDLFMLGFYLIGINLSDLLELPSGCIKHGRLQYRRNKTGRLYDIKVEPEAMEIINKYKGKGHLLDILDDGQVKETSFRRTLGNYLKRIGPVRMEKNSRGALIKKVITPLHEDMIWYTARRSWATIAAELDIPKETIGKALGHSEWDSTTTDRYIQFDNKKIDEANRKVIDALGDKLAG